MKKRGAKLLILPVIASALFTGSLSHANQCSHFLRNPLNAENRAQLTKDYAERVFRTEEENKTYIRSAFSLKKQGLYLEFTISLLKELNDTIINDKDLVTALVNLHKEHMFEAFIKVLEKHNIKNPPTYSDFKTGRLFLETSKDKIETIAHDFEATFIKADKAYKTELLNKGLVRKADLNQQWGHLGISFDPDLASIGARLAKVKGKKTQTVLKKNLKEIEEDRKKIINDFKVLQKNESMSFIFKSSSKLRLKLVELFRKNKNVKDFISAVRENFHMKISDLQANSIMKFLKSVDMFSPSLLIKERTSVAIDDAPFGAFSLDFVGLGAKNLRSTLEGILESTSVETMIKKIREKEQEITEVFKDQQLQIYDVVDTYFKENSGESFLNKNLDQRPEIRFSGDEGIIIPPREVSLDDMLKLQKKLFEVFNYSGLRMTFLHPNVKGVDGKYKIDTNLVSSAEGIEKSLRKRLVGLIGLEILEQVQFNVFIPRSFEKHKKAYLNLYTPIELTEAQKIYVKTHFTDLVLEMNQSKQEGEPNLIPGEDVFGLVGPQ